MRSKPNKSIITENATDRFSHVSRVLSAETWGD